MVRDAVRGYLALASGLTEVTAARAKSAARALVEQGEATATQVTSLAEDLVSTSRRNRESLAVLVRHEVEQAVRRVGLAPSLQLDDLSRRVRELERTIRELQAAAAKQQRTAANDVGTAEPRPTAKKAAPAKKTAKKAAAKKAAPAKKATKKAAAKKAPIKRAGASRRAATTKRATKSVAKKSAARRVARKRRS